MSLGNILLNPRVGCLFIDFSDGARLRVNGRASIREHGPLLALFPQQARVVLVDIEQVVPNCARHVPRLQPPAAPRSGRGLSCRDRRLRRADHAPTLLRVRRCHARPSGTHARRPGRRPVPLGHAETDLARSAGADSALRRREPGPGRGRKRGRQRHRTRRPPLAARPRPPRSSSVRATGRPPRPASLPAFRPASNSRSSAWIASRKSY